MSEFVWAGQTSQTIDVFLQDSSSTTGQGLSGLVFNSAGLVASYRKGATGSRTAITLATQTVGGAYSSGGLVEIDATNMKGVYRLDLPNAMVDSEGFATLFLYGATNLLPTALRIDCRALPVDVKKLLGTAWLTPAVAGTPDVNAKTVTDGAITAAAIATDAITAAKIADGAIDTATFASGTTIPRVTLADTVTTLTGHTAQTGDSFARIGVAGAGLTAVDDATLAAIAGLNNLSSAQVTAAVPTVVAIGNEVQTRTIARVTLVDTCTTNTDMRGTDNAALAATALSTAVWTATIAGRIDVASSTLATAANLAIVAGYLNTEIAAIKTKTDQLTFTTANKVDSTAVLDSATRVKLSSEQPDYAPAKSEDVNAQILDVLTVDTFQELSYPPTATSSLKDKIAWLFMWARNKVVQSTTDRKLYADDDLTIVSTESTVDGGSSFTKGKAT